MSGSKVLILACLVAGCTNDRDGLAGGVAITDLAILQGPSIPLVADLVPVATRTAPVLAARRGRLHTRIGYEDGSEPREVTVRYTVTDAAGKAHAISQTAAIPGGAAGSTDVDLDFDDTFVTPGATLNVAVYEQAGFVSSNDEVTGVRQPPVGEIPLDPREAPPFRVVVVPASTAMSLAPPITDAQLAAWRGTLHALWPIGDVEISVAPELDTRLDLTSDPDWGKLLVALAARRAADGVDPDVFYFGATGIIPRSTIGGIAVTTNIEDPYWRVASGQMGGTIEADSNLFAHELGHSIGRSHAPCGNPGGPDYAYPYDNAQIGVVGLDLRDDTLRDPTHYYDFMSYCRPVFVSDYQFGAAYESLHWLESSTRVAPGESVPTFIADPVLR